MSVNPLLPASGSADAAITITGLGKLYRMYSKPADRLKQMLWGGVFGQHYGREFWALRDVDFTLQRGEAFALVGRNGCGKSTLLLMLAGVLTPTVGRIDTGRRRIAALLELGAGFNQEFTGLENARLNASMLGLGPAEIEDRLPDILAFADIGEFIHQPVKTYSSGMFVRLAFAVAVNTDPEILLVDEALAVGDALFQKRCYERIEAMLKRGTTLIFVSHDQEAVRTLCQRALLLDHGRPVAIGPAGEVLLEYRRRLHQDEQRYFQDLIEQQAVSRQSAPLATQPTTAAPSTPALPVADGRSGLMAFGDGRAVLTAVRVRDRAGVERNHFTPGDTICIEIDVNFIARVEHPNVAIRIRNKEGVKIYSWGTLNQDIAIWSGRASAGPVFWAQPRGPDECVTVEISFPCALGTNMYEVQASVSDELDRYYGAQRTLNWRDEAAFFHVSVDQRMYFFGGCTDLKAIAHVRD